MVTKKSPATPSGLPTAPCDPHPPKILTDSDGRDLRYIFVSPPKFVVGTTVPDPIYFQLLDYPGGISGFYEDAVAKFDGDVEALLRAAVLFSEIRKRARNTTAIRSANGRVSKGAHDRVLAIEGSLKGIRGISKAKVLAGLIHLYLDKFMGV
jgi:hypothetical protein